MKNKSLLDKYIESLSYDELMEYLGTQGLRGITLPVYEGKTPYECLCAHVKQVMVAEETKLLKNDDYIMSDEKIFIEQLKDYTYLFDFYKKHYEELKLYNSMMVHSKFVDHLRDKIYECADKLLRLEIQKENNDIDVAPGQWKFIEEE